jgi:hypothetical protein
MRSRVTPTEALAVAGSKLAFPRNGKPIRRSCRIAHAIICGRAVEQGDHARQDDARTTSSGGFGSGSAALASRPGSSRRSESSTQAARTCSKATRSSRRATCSGRTRHHLSRPQHRHQHLAYVLKDGESDCPQAEARPRGCQCSPGRAHFIVQGGPKRNEILAIARAGAMARGQIRALFPPDRYPPGAGTSIGFGQSGPSPRGVSCANACRSSYAKAKSGRMESRKGAFFEHAYLEAPAVTSKVRSRSEPIEDVSADRVWCATQPDHALRLDPLQQTSDSLHRFGSSRVGAWPTLEP